MLKPTVEGPINQKALISYSQSNRKYAKALRLAVKVFEKDKRQFTGLKYASHAMTVATMLLEVKADLQTMVVSALQDLPRKATFKPEELAAEYGDEVLKEVLALQIGGDAAAYAATLSEKSELVHTILAASLLDEVCSVPKKVVNSDEAKVVFQRAITLEPHLTKADATLLRRLSAIVKKIKVQA